MNRRIGAALPQLPFDFTDDRSHVDVPHCRLSRHVIHGEVPFEFEIFSNAIPRILANMSRDSESQRVSILLMAETRRKNWTIDWRISSGDIYRGVSCAGRELPKDRMVMPNWRGRGY